MVDLQKIPTFISELTVYMILKRKGQISNPDTITLTKKSNHMCAILTTSGIPIMFGSNFYNIPRGSVKSTEHAESIALSKLAAKMGRVRRKIHIDILVVRTNMGNSMPCDRCMQKISEAGQRFHIRYIYYTKDGKIECIKFSKLVKIINK